MKHVSIVNASGYIPPPKQVSIIGGQYWTIVIQPTHYWHYQYYSNHRLHPTVHGVQGPVCRNRLDEAVASIKWKGPPPNHFLLVKAHFFQFQSLFAAKFHVGIPITHNPQSTRPPLSTHAMHGQITQPRFGNRGASLLSNLPTNPLSSNTSPVWTHLFLVRNLAS